MLVSHVRTADRKPFATIVATEPNRIAFSLCSPKDTFNKKMGRLIAKGRAESEDWNTIRLMLPRWLFKLNQEGKFKYYSDFCDALTKMEGRAQAYFKTTVVEDKEVEV